MEFKDALAFAAPWGGRVIWKDFIGHIFLECFSGRLKSFAGRVLGGWTVSSFYQLYAGHPVDVYSGMARFQAQTCNDPLCLTETFYNDQNGIPFNIGGDYNLDGVANDHPVFTGSSVSSAYSHANPADGIFKDNHLIGCGFPGSKSTNIQACNDNYGVGTPNSLFTNPAGATAK